MESQLVSDRLVALCERLAATTVAGAAEWRNDSEDRFVWETGEGSVAIGSRDRDGEPPYQLAVYNRDRIEVDGLVSQLVDDDRPAPWNAALTDLYRVARRSALRADELLDRLLALLPVPPRSEEPARAEAAALAE
jgi:ankyrin repeat protein